MVRGHDGHLNWLFVGPGLLRSYEPGLSWLKDDGLTHDYALQQYLRALVTP